MTGYAPTNNDPPLIAKYTHKTVTVHFAGFAPDLGDPVGNRALFEALRSGRGLVPKKTSY
jgi:hypothetical protein